MVKTYDSYYLNATQNHYTNYIKSFWKYLCPITHKHIEKYSFI